MSLFVVHDVLEFLSPYGEREIFTFIADVLLVEVLVANFGSSDDDDGELGDDCLPDFVEAIGRVGEEYVDDFTSRTTLVFGQFAFSDPNENRDGKRCNFLQKFILNSASSPQESLFCRLSFSGNAIKLSTNEEDVSMAIAKFHGLDAGGVELGELDMGLWCDSDHG